MNNEQHLKSKNAKQYRLLYGIGVVVLGIIGVVSTKNAFASRYIDGTALLFAFLAFSVGLYLLNYLVNRRTFELSKKKIIVRNKLRTKVFQAHEIQGFKEESYDDKYQSGRTLVFQVGRKFLTLDSND